MARGTTRKLKGQKDAELGDRLQYINYVAEQLAERLATRLTLGCPRCTEAERDAFERRATMEALRRAIKERFKSQREAARAVGMGETSFSHALAGRRPLPLAVRKRLRGLGLLPEPDAGTGQSTRTG